MSVSLARGPGGGGRPVCGPPRRRGRLARGHRGGRLTNEGAYAWARVAKGVVGTDSVDAQLGDGLPAELVLGLPRPTIDQAAAASTVVLLSGDLRRGAPDPLPAPAGRRRRRGPGHRRALTPGHVADRPCRRVAALRTGRRRGAGRRPGGCRGKPTGGGQGRRGPPRRRLSGPPRAGSGRRGGRSPVIGRGRRVGGRCGPEACPGPSRGALPAGAPSGGRAAGGASTWGWPRDCSRAVSRSRMAGPGSTEAWGGVPAGRGRGTADILAAAAGDQAEGAPVTALVLLGADPLSDFPDRRLARRARRAPDSWSPWPVPRVPSSTTPMSSYRRPRPTNGPGTTTNIEGRISPPRAEARAPGPGVARLDDRR